MLSPGPRMGLASLRSSMAMRFTSQLCVHRVYETIHTQEMEDASQQAHIKLKMQDGTNPKACSPLTQWVRLAQRVQEHERGRRGDEHRARILCAVGCLACYTCVNISVVEA